VSKIGQHKSIGNFRVISKARQIPVLILDTAGGQIPPRFPTGFWADFLSKSFKNHLKTDGKPAKVPPIIFWQDSCMSCSEESARVGPGGKPANF